ncbi:T-box transcription factor TBX1-like [Pan troglodytes]|uniref:T-box transcription factor TBX1-like n=1 Tax=Pan troglodytes TaxID=9598 RepID=UPI0023EFB4D2|nr:T-box transcription factor TBX1-like [Pan troglodytes]
MGESQVQALPHREAAEALPEFECSTGGGPALLGDPVHTPQLLAQLLSPSLPEAGGASRPLGVRGPPNPRPPGTRAGPQAPRAARVPAHASLSTPPLKLREPALASASPERGFHSAAAGSRAPQARPEWAPRPSRRREQGRAASAASMLSPLRMIYDQGVPEPVPHKHQGMTVYSFRYHEKTQPLTYVFN